MGKTALGIIYPVFSKVFNSLYDIVVDMKEKCGMHENIVKWVYIWSNKHLQKETNFSIEGFFFYAMLNAFITRLNGNMEA